MDKRPWYAQLGIQAVLLLYASTVIIPLALMLFNSVKSMKEIYTRPYWLPTVFMWSNYVKAWQQAKFAIYLKNSLFISLTTVLFVLLCGSMAAYVLARFRFKGSAFIMGLFLVGLMLPIRLAIIPLFLLMRDLHLINTHAALILIYTASAMPFTIFLLSTFMRNVPKELEEAAVVEGAGWFTVYWQIILPLVRPALATVAIFNFMGTWNDFFFPLIFLKKPALMTVPVGISAFFGEYGNQWPLLFAALSITMVPVILVFLAMSRQFIAGLTAGALK